MTGHPAELGIIPCAVDGVFDAITADRDRAFLLRVSYIEIYNETLRDLLNFKKTGKDVPAIHTNKVCLAGGRRALIIPRKLMSAGEGIR